MKRSFLHLYLAGALLFLSTTATAQQQPARSSRANQPTYRVTMVPRTILAINYQNRTKTQVGF